MSESGRSGTISAPSIDESAHNASTIDINQGRASYRIPIVLPPGHPNIQPSMALVYTGTRDEGVVGAGWSLTVPTIGVRKIGRNGQPRFGTTVTYIGLNGEPLIDIQQTVSDLDQDGADDTVYFEERNTTHAR
ncbi:MAG: SpvB/TcaC N-terminal domain-containing protein, partial [Pseudomonadota bacterium]